MLTLEPDFKQAESIARGAKDGVLTDEQAQWIDGFYRNVQGRMLNLYDAARLGAWQIYDREQLAAYWKEQAEWFGVQLAHTERLEQHLADLGVPEQKALHDAINSLREIVEACSGAYELHA
jgi:hypothetical protein